MFITHALVVKASVISWDQRNDDWIKKKAHNLINELIIADSYYHATSLTTHKLISREHSQMNPGPIQLYRTMKQPKIKLLIA